jgi:glutaredoxin-dependent peroxiredoxin
MSIKVGDFAPEFNLKSHQGGELSLSSLKGDNVLLLFFPFAFSGICTKELCQTRDDLAFYNSVNAKVIGISVDSHHTQSKFAEVYGLDFPLLSDFNKAVMTAYGTIYDDFIGYYKGVAKRSAFVVDKEGVIRYAEVLESAGDIPNFEAIQGVLKELA